MPFRLLLTSSMFAALALGCAHARNDAAPRAELSLKSLDEHSVLGALGVPLGTVVEIRATVVAGGESRTKGAEGVYLLRVTEVDGHPVETAPVMHFAVPPFVSVNLANDDAGLCELKTRSTGVGVDSAQLDEPRREYAGKRVRLVAYEIGQFTGVPDELPSDIPRWQDRSFGFSTSLVVLAKRP